MYPINQCFIAILRKNYGKFSKLEVLCSAFFFRKYTQKFQKNPEILLSSQNKKKIIFESKLVQNHYIHQNLSKLSRKIQRIVKFSLKTSILEFYVGKKPIYLELGPPGPRPPRSSLVLGKG